MPKEYVPADLKRLVIWRARGCCEYCRTQARYAPEAFSIEHIMPRATGGPTVESNLALSCQGCNSHKGVRTSAHDLITGFSVVLFHPRQHQWNEHFAWAEDYTVIRGLTAIGRATVAALWLNREGLINMRWVLYGIGEHPPEADDPLN